MRRPNRVTSFLLFLLAATVVTSAARLYGQGSSSRNVPAQNHTVPMTRDKDGVGFEAQFPTADLEPPEPSDPDQRITRQSKGKRYDRLPFVARKPELSVDESVLDNHWQEGV